MTSIDAGTNPQGMRRPEPHRFPLQALADAMGMTLDKASRTLGVSGSTLQEYRDRGITERVADRLAIRAGLHPADVWPDWYDHQLAADSVECADEKCDQLFVPSRSYQRFCSRTCQQRNKHRRRHARLRQDPERREAELARVRAYKAQHREGLARQRRLQRRREQARAQAGVAA